MIFICSISIISNIFVVNTLVEGKLLAETKTSYYIDFTEDAKKNNWVIDGRDGKVLVPKDKCVKKP